MAYIYKITNNINGKIYVGKTNNSIEQRFRQHCLDSTREGMKNRPLYAAMNKYGIENFSISLIEETNNPEERERYWIECYGSFHDGYNATRGGDGKPYADYELIYILYQEVKTISKVREITGYDCETISHALEVFGITKEEKEENRTAPRRKRVAKCDAKSGEILTVYSSIAEAEADNGNTRHIVDVCHGRRKTCKGFAWRYI